MIPWQSLEQMLEGELSRSRLELQEHSEDASIYQAMPAAVAYPRNIADCKALLRFCREEGLGLHPWGAGTSRGGQPLGRGIVVNFRRHMNKVLSLDEKTGELSVEPGAFYSEVQSFLQPHWRSFPPDPSFHQCTIGGMIANNAAGIRSVKYGATLEHLSRLQFLCGEGDLHHTDEPDLLSEKVDAFLRLHAGVISEGYPSVEKNSSGYNLHLGLNADGFLDLPRLLAGSEGTLALITEARLFTVEQPGGKALGFLCFQSLEAALSAAMDLRTFDISACELVDRVLLDLHSEASQGRARGPTHARKIGGNPFLETFHELKAEAVLIVEIEGEGMNEAVAQLKEAFQSLKPAPMKAVIAENFEQASLIWELRRHTSPILNRLEGGKITIKPLWGVEDVSLPPATFLSYVSEQKALFERHGITCSFFGHAGSCNLHIDPLGVDPRLTRTDSALAALYDRVAAESYALVIRKGGAISGEHGDGLSRTRFLPQQYPKVYPLFAELKAIFDPHAILNPGKIVAEPLKEAKHG